MGIATAEYECKMNWIQKKEGEFNMDRCNLAFKYAIDNDMEFRGHALVWGATNTVPNIVPSWAKWITDENRLRNILKGHIDHVMTDIRAENNGARVLAWDVVNEAVTNDCHSDDILKRSTSLDQDARR